jgi:hypothetical protein
MSESFVRVPPDSTGKRLQTIQHEINGDEVQTPVYHLGDPIYPEYRQYVDARGQANIRFAEGSPTVESFGKLRTSEPVFMGGYEFTNNDMSDLFTDQLENGGSLQYNENSSDIVLSVTDSSGSRAVRTTNRYHYYTPGSSISVMISISTSDGGKAGNIRRWGYYDDNDGAYFELNGTDWNIVRRSSTSGSVVEERISYGNWNGISQFGVGEAQFFPDPTKMNIYWLDFSWLGSGTIRFGMVAPDGQRITIHTMKNPNSHNRAYMRSGSLPFRIENLNVSDTSGASGLRLVCASVYTENRIDYTYWRFSDISNDLPKTLESTNTPIVSMRATEGSRVGIYPEKLSIFISGGPAMISVVDTPDTITGDTWGIESGEGFSEGDDSATEFVGGNIVHSWFFDEGAHTIDLSVFYEVNDEGFCRYADDSGSYVFMVVGKKLNGVDTVSASAIIGYKELR